MKWVATLAAVVVAAGWAQAQCGPLGCNAGQQVAHVATAPVRFVMGGFEAVRTPYLRPRSDERPVVFHRIRQAMAERRQLFQFRRGGCR